MEDDADDDAVGTDAIVILSRFDIVRVEAADEASPPRADRDRAWLSDGVWSVRDVDDLLDVRSRSRSSDM